MPRRSVLRAVAAGSAATAAALVGLEGFWRARGFRPELNDSAELWCRERRRATLTTNVLAIVGSSRAQFGLDPQRLGAELSPRRVVQLAIKGVPALPVLRHLAEDESFRGIVLCEVTPQHVFSSERHDLEAVHWLGFYQSRPWVSPIEGELRLLAQTATVQVQPTLELRSVFMSWLAGGRLPKPPYLRLREDRFMQAHYAWVDAKRFRPNLIARAERETLVPSETQLLQLFERIRGYKDALRRRGGDLIFLRMISSGAVRAVEDTRLPREHYWDRLLQEVGVPGVYFDEVPGAASMECPDASHLDVRDASRFSSALGELLKARGLV